MSEMVRQSGSRLSQPKTLASIVANTYTYAVSRGVSSSRIHALTGLLRTSLLDPDARLPEEIVPMMWTLLREAHPAQVLTLHMAEGTPLSYFGLLAQCLQYADTLDAALETFIRYSPMLSDRLCLDWRESDSEAILRLYHPTDDIDGGCSSEVTLAMLKQLIQSIIGVDDFLVRVELVRSPYQGSQTDHDFWGTSVCFRQPGNALVFHRAALDWPVLQPDSHLFKYIQNNLELQLKACEPISHVSPLSELQAAIARNAESGDYTAEALARTMNMSLRALQRLAKAQGFTIRQLIDNAREERARQLLVDSTLGVEVISSELGYSDDRAFRRAFKRWAGQTPAEFRRQPDKCEKI